MSFFPASFDPRAEVVGALTLASVDTVDGLFNFMVGTDGVFTDTLGRAWVGSTLIGSSDIEQAINGVAPAGEATLSWFDDPALRDPESSVMEQVKALGADYVRGRALTFYVQPLTDFAQFWQPVIAPIPFARYTMQSLVFSFDGPLQRSITLRWEGVFGGRQTARGWYYTTADHAKLIGAANPSLTYMPKDNMRTEQLF